MRRSLLLALALATAAAAQAAPVYVGAASRGGLAGETTQAFRGALEAAVARHGVKVLDTRGTAGDDAEGSLAKARAALDDAAAAYSENRLTECLADADDALAEFERGPAFSAERSAWALFRDIHAMRALAAVGLKRAAAADAAIAALLAVEPGWAPSRSRTPKELMRHIDDVGDELRSLPPVALQVESKPNGATVMLDGKRQGKAPLVIEGLTPGVHYLTVTSARGRFVQRVELGDEDARVVAKVGSKKGAAAREVTQLLEQPLGAARLVEAVSDVDDDALVVVLLPAGKQVEVIGARIIAGEVAVVAGVRVPDNENDRDRATYELIEGLLEKSGDAWLDQASADDPHTLRPKLFGGTGTTEEEEQLEISPAVLASAIIGGAVVVVVVGVATVAVVLREVQKDENFTFGVDASRL
ncbi:MAG: PEGA domain-containing protein [Deltaproteobacteria bacterium]|nr:PEGA domain-containing protein [Deltaproteobacteria bacterium]